MSRARKGQGSIYKESHPTRLTKWRGEKLVRLPDGSRRRIVVRGRSHAETEALLTARERQLARAHPDAEKQTARQFFDRWLEHQELRVRSNTARGLRANLSKASAAFGHIPLANVKPLHIQLAIDAALRAGQPNTADGVRRAVTQAFKQAVRWELLARNPAENIPPVPIPTPIRSVWQPDEARRFLSAAGESLHGGYYGLFYAALMTGMRKGELIALRWEDVAEASVFVRSTATVNGVGPPKTKAGVRRIPIMPTAYDALAAARASMPESEWAFPSKAGTMLGARNVERAFKRTLEKANLKTMRLHDVRRTTATWWAASGATPKVIQQLLGHSTPNLALAIYTDVLEGQAESAALNPSRWLGGGGFGGNSA